MTPDRDALLVWGKPGDGKGARLGLLIATAIIVALFTWILTNDAGEPARYEVQPTEVRCDAEDELIVRLEEDDYDLASGALFCVHVDTLIPPEETSDVAAR